MVFADEDGDVHFFKAWRMTDDLLRKVVISPKHQGHHTGTIWAP